MTTPKPPVITNPWDQLRRYTDARIALGRAGVSLPSRAQLEFQLAHARARDAVHLPLDRQRVRERLQALGRDVIELHSAAADRQEYLQRPDRGRRLNEDSRQRLAGLSQGWDAVFVVADGLSALAVHEHAAAFLGLMLERLDREGWRLAPIALVEQGRVAIGDEIGELLGAAMAAVLIGERPGLSSPDSLGVYLSYGPKRGLTDAQRNCISNIRREGLQYPGAAHKLYYLMSEARRRRLTGVRLKDEAQAQTDSLEGPAVAANFLID